jgi:TolA-binding protein
LRFLTAGLVLLGFLVGSGVSGAENVDGTVSKQGEGREYSARPLSNSTKLSWQGEAGDMGAVVAPVGILVPESYSFAQSLMKKGYWEEAAVEFQRFCFLSPGHPFAAKAKLAIGRCYEQGGELAKAIAAYRAVAKEHPNTPSGLEGHYRIGEAAYLAGEYDTARQELTGFLDSHPASSWKWPAQYRIAWSSLRLHSFYVASEQFTSIAAMESPFREQAGEIVQGIGQVGDLPYRSPWMAGLLSCLLPGAGQVYAGAYKDGLLSLLVNGALIAASYEAIDKEVYGAGGLVSLVTLTFYSGNIYGAVNSAHHANMEALTTHLRTYRRQYEWIPEGE